MVIKEKKLAILIYLLRYGRMTRDECSTCLNLHSQRALFKEWLKLLEIPGIFSDKDKYIIYSFYYIISHQIPVFYDHIGTKILLKNVKTKSPTESLINYSNNVSLREYFS